MIHNLSGPFFRGQKGRWQFQPLKMRRTASFAQFFQPLERVFGFNLLKQIFVYFKSG